VGNEIKGPEGEGRLDCQRLNGQGDYRDRGRNVRLPFLTRTACRRSTIPSSQEKDNVKDAGEPLIYVIFGLSKKKGVAYSRDELSG